MFFTLILILLIAGLIKLTLSQPKFGRIPRGARLERIKRSPNYRGGQFQNLSKTPNLAEGHSYAQVMSKFFFGDRSRTKPRQPLPSTKTDLHTLDPKDSVLVWFGHSSYFLQLDGKRILVDPVLSGHASPFAFTTRAFPGADRYTPDDIPPIDYLFLTHDHWDHLDHDAIVALKPKIGKVITGLGTGEHLELWGYDPSKIIEEDWNTRVDLGDGFVAHLVPARHFSGRTFTRNRALWTAFVLESPTMRILLGGDSGYDTHFAEIGKRFGSFDLAILENGQYDKAWRYIHLFPEEVLQAGKELNARRVLPVHSGKFGLSNHDWDTPLKTITAKADETGVKLITPMIGERVNLKDEDQRFSHWWEGLS